MFKMIKELLWPKVIRLQHLYFTLGSLQPLGVGLHSCPAITHSLCLNGLVLSLLWGNRKSVHIYYKHYETSGRHWKCLIVGRLNSFRALHNKFFSWDFHLHVHNQFLLSCYTLNQIVWKGHTSYWKIIPKIIWLLAFTDTSELPHVSHATRLKFH